MLISFQGPKVFVGSHHWNDKLAFFFVIFLYLCVLSTLVDARLVGPVARLTNCSAALRQCEDPQPDKKAAHSR